MASDILSLPNEILLNIFSYLPTNVTLIKPTTGLVLKRNPTVALVCRRFHFLASRKEFVPVHKVTADNVRHIDDLAASDLKKIQVLLLELSPMPELAIPNQRWMVHPHRDITRPGMRDGRGKFKWEVVGKHANGVLGHYLKLCARLNRWSKMIKWIRIFIPSPRPYPREAYVMHHRVVRLALDIRLELKQPLISFMDEEMESPLTGYNRLAALRLKEIDELCVRDGLKNLIQYLETLRSRRLVFNEGSRTQHCLCYHWNNGFKAYANFHIEELTIKAIFTNETFPSPRKIHAVLTRLPRLTKLKIVTPIYISCLPKMIEAIQSANPDLTFLSIARCPSWGWKNRKPWNKTNPDHPGFYFRKLPGNYRNLPARNPRAQLDKLKHLEFEMRYAGGEEDQIVQMLETRCPNLSTLELIFDQPANFLGDRPEWMDSPTRSRSLLLIVSTHPGDNDNAGRESPQRVVLFRSMVNVETLCRYFKSIANVKNASSKLVNPQGGLYHTNQFAARSDDLRINALFHYQSVYVRPAGEDVDKMVESFKMNKSGLSVPWACHGCEPALRRDPDYDASDKFDLSMEFTTDDLNVIQKYPDIARRDYFDGYKRCLLKHNLS